jgi:hypothetical protein
MRISQVQLQIQREDGDESFLQEVFAAAEAQFFLFDTTDAALTEDSICEYSQGIGFGPGFRARKLGGLIVMDFSAHEARVEEFSAAVEFITSHILARAGDRMTCVNIRYSPEVSEKRVNSSRFDNPKDSFVDRPVKPPSFGRPTSHCRGGLYDGTRLPILGIFPS